MSICLASAGNNGLKTWHFDKKKLSTDQFIHENTNMRCVRFNHNNKIVASCDTNGKIRLDLVERQEHLSTLTVPNSDPKKQKVNCIQFSSRSRFLLCGGDDTIVRVWDLKKQDVRCSFTSHRYAITSVAFVGPKDDQVASGDKSGQIFLHSLVNGQKSCSMNFRTLVPSNSSPNGVRSMQYTPHKKTRSSLGVAYNDGSVCVWDINSGKATSKFIKKHSSSATSVAFSPVNKLLMASAGLDKNVFFYDIDQNLEVKCMNISNPVTSLSLYADGHTLLVGTILGEILLFDLRGGSTPICSVNGHGPDPVYFVQVGNEVLNQNSSSKLHSVSSSASLLSTKSEISDKYVYPETKFIHKANSFAEVSSTTPNESSVTDFDKNLDISKSEPKNSYAAKSDNLMSSESEKKKISGASNHINQPTVNFASKPHLSIFNTNIESLEEILDEKFENWKCDVNDNIRNLYLDILKQNQLQQVATTAAISTLTKKIDKLIQENSDLRKENEELKNIY